MQAETLQRCKGMKKMGIYIGTCKNENDDIGSWVHDITWCISLFILIHLRKKSYRILTLYQVDSAHIVFIGKPELVHGGMQALMPEFGKRKNLAMLME